MIEMGCSSRKTSGVLQYVHDKYSSRLLGFYSDKKYIYLSIIHHFETIESKQLMLLYEYNLSFRY